MTTDTDTLLTSPESLAGFHSYQTTEVSEQLLRSGWMIIKKYFGALSLDQKLAYFLFFVFDD